MNKRYWVITGKYNRSIEFSEVDMDVTLQTMNNYTSGTQTPYYTTYFWFR